jgi:hypothetical protein
MRWICPYRARTNALIDSHQKLSMRRAARREAAAEHAVGAPKASEGAMDMPGNGILNLQRRRQALKIDFESRLPSPRCLRPDAERARRQQISRHAAEHPFAEPAVCAGDEQIGPFIMRQPDQLGRRRSAQAAPSLKH